MELIGDVEKMPDQRPDQSYQDWITETLWSDVQSRAKTAGMNYQSHGVQSDSVKIISLGREFKPLDLKMLSDSFVGKRLVGKFGAEIGMIESADAILNNGKELELNYQIAINCSCFYDEVTCCHCGEHFNENEEID